MDRSIAMPSCLDQAKAIDTISSSRLSPVVSISAANTGYWYSESKSSRSDPYWNPYSSCLIHKVALVPVIALMPMSIKRVLSGCLNNDL